MNPFNDEYFMKQALVEARAAASEGEVPVGAVIVCNNQIIARAHNQTECLNDVTAHAEMLAITAAAGVLGAKYLTNCSLYVTVEPCIMCAGAIGWAQLSTIVYGASDDKRGFSKFAPQAFHPKAIIKKGILEKECAEEMQCTIIIIVPGGSSRRTMSGSIAICLTTLFSLTSVVSATKKDVLKGTQDGETHQKHQQDKEKEYYKQKLKHNPILK